MSDKRIGGELAKRQLHFFFLLDCSGSMQSDSKIQTLNAAIRGSIPLMKKTAEDNPEAEVMVRAIKFNSSAQWHIQNPTSVADLKWEDVDADGLTAMGQALSMVAKAFRSDMPRHGLPPVLVLISDGQPSDDFGKGLKELMAEPWGKKAVRLSIAIGRDADLDVLQKFNGNPEIKPLKADNPEALMNFVKWTSTAVIDHVSSPPSNPKGGTSKPKVNIPKPPPNASAQDGDNDVW